MPISLTQRFMKAFGNGIWGEVADRTVEMFVLAGGILGILIGGHWSLKKIVETQWESIAIAVTAVSLLIIWHAFRSAYAVSTEIGEERAIGFSAQPMGASFPRVKLYGIATCLSAVALLASLLSWSLTITPKSLRPIVSPTADWAAKQHMETQVLVHTPLAKRLHVSFCGPELSTGGDSKKLPTVVAMKSECILRIISPKNVNLEKFQIRARVYNSYANLNDAFETIPTCVKISADRPGDHDCIVTIVERSSPYRVEFNKLRDRGEDYEVDLTLISVDGKSIGTWVAAMRRPGL
jgi:hypothetical protein